MRTKAFSKRRDNPHTSGGEDFTDSSTYRSLCTHLLDLYGEETFKDVRRLDTSLKTARASIYRTEEELLGLQHPHH
jgi:hypothetical protein